MKVLVLTRSMGEGHNRAAKAIGEAFTANGHDCQVSDALSIANAGQSSVADDTSHGLNKHLHDVASGLYGWTALRAPFLFGAVYKLGEVYTRTPVPSPIYVASARLAEQTYKFIEEHEYDAVVAPHLFPQETLNAIRKHHKTRARHFAVLTDYTCIPFFSEAKVDGYCIPHADLLKECRSHGIPLGHTTVTGLPVAAAFQTPPSQASAREMLGLPQDRPLFLVMSGGVGSTRLSELCARLLTAGGEDMHVAVLTGRSEGLFLQIADRYQSDPRVTVVPFTERVPDYMAAADVMLSKPGGVSSTEAAVMGLPLVHTATIPGNETKNARFFSRHGMSLYAPRIEDAVQAAHKLINDEACQRRMQDDQRSNTMPDSAQRVVTQVEAVVG